MYKLIITKVFILRDKIIDKKKKVLAKFNELWEKNLISLNNYIYKILPHLVFGFFRINKNNLKKKKIIRICFFGNVANNHYSTIKVLNKFGYKADLLISNYFDNYKFNNPISDDISYDWKKFKNVKKKKIGNSTIIYSTQRQTLCNFTNYFNFLNSIKKKYEAHFSFKLNYFEVILLSTQWSHWNTIKKFKDYDFIIFSSGGILLAPFCNKPYAIFPTGSDSTVSPFQNTLEGKIYKIAYKKANILTPGSSNPKNYQYLVLNKLKSKQNKIVPQTLLYPVDDYNYNKKNRIKKKFIFFSQCRHDWIQKKNQLIIRSLNKCDNKKINFIFIDYGRDVLRSKKLVNELNLNHCVKFIQICSKKKIRELIQESDLIFEQFGMDAYSTGCFEAMMCKKPVIMNYPKKKDTDYQYAPIIHASSIIEITSHINSFLKNQRKFVKIGYDNYKWMKENKCGKKNALKYIQNIIKNC